MANLIHLPLLPNESVNLIAQFMKQMNLDDNNREVVQQKIASDFSFGTDVGAQVIRAAVIVSTLTSTFSSQDYTGASYGTLGWPFLGETISFISCAYSDHPETFMDRRHHMLLQLQVPGLVNVDFADVRAIMENAGSSLMGIGTATGKTRAGDAALNAIQSPLLDIGIERATGIVWNITGGSDLTLYEDDAMKNLVTKLHCKS
ncbi:hypothetical protein HYC85_019953 [Camellia sinensis]|uniref:Tubulin/FtsZ 2-layer sandwich domain-containing protein n=1 Tax=Camellia sinensis TaxID=4442 RepID=A0A7J7GQX9_CAMSI|nr:hypothetical protein HYC85_019953 [Camellia sinensis]